MPSAAYFPDGGPVSRQIAFSPVSQYDAPNAIQAQDAPDKIRPSDEQGIGRSPGQQWPHMRHAEQFNHAQLCSGTSDVERGPNLGALVNRAARQGWSAPVFYEQRRQHYVWPVPISIDQAPSRQYTTLANLGG